jgi:hypothetical protein
VAFNTGSGITMGVGQATNSDGLTQTFTPIGNSLSQNSIFGNGQLGIDLLSAARVNENAAGVSFNDDLDSDSGPTASKTSPLFRVLMQAAAQRH